MSPSKFIIMMSSSPLEAASSAQPYSSARVL